MVHAYAAQAVVSFVTGVHCCSCKCSHTTFIAQAQQHGTYTKETLQFMQNILQTSGLGEETYMPPSATT